MMMYMEARMGDVMVRKQIYLPRRQNQLVKRLAKQRGVSEAEVIRQALSARQKCPRLWFAIARGRWMRLLPLRAPCVSIPN